MAGVALALEGRVALITGGSRGIGAETVRLFAEAGARVAFNYRRAREQAEALAAECGGPERCVALKQDLSSPADGHVLVEAAVRAFGRLDVLVANHGIWEPEDVPIAEMTESQWRRTLAVNLDSVFGLVQAAVAQMDRQRVEHLPTDRSAGIMPSHPSRKNKDAARVGHPQGYSFSQDAPVSQPGGAAGHIVLISSTAGQRGEANHADYAVTKGALISLTKSLSSELAPRGIRVNCVAPGWVVTDMSEAALDHPELGPRIVSGIPVGRPASTREIAGPVLFLCTPLAGFISGEVLNVNGGSVLVG